MINIRNFVREKNWIVVLILMIIGVTLLWGSKYLDKSSEIYILVINLGTTSIVSAIAMWILSPIGKEIEKQVEEQIDKINEQILIVKKKLLDKSDQLKEELTDKLDILSQAKKCGIVHIFECRRGDTNFKKKLIEQFQNIGENKKVLLMSNSLRDFFITRPPNDEYPKLIFDMLKKNVKFNILMLDPTSNAARSRAWVEERRRIEKGGYINSTLFKDIKLVADRLRDPSAWIDDELAKRIKAQIEVRFYPYDPTTFMIRTDKYTFIEQYHRGGDERIKNALKDPLIDCFGGFVPVLMVENSAFYAKLMDSHFQNIWNSDDVKMRDLKNNNYYEKILIFERDEIPKR